MTDLGEKIRKHYSVFYILVLLSAMFFYVVLSFGEQHVWADELYLWDGKAVLWRDVAPSQCGCSSVAVLFRKR